MASAFSVVTHRGMPPGISLHGSRKSILPRSFHMQAGQSSVLLGGRYTYGQGKRRRDSSGHGCKLASAEETGVAERKGQILAKSHVTVPQWVPT